MFNIKFAIFQPSQKHTEIFGTFIEYFLKMGFNFDIFYNSSNDKYSFIDYYQRLFNKKFKIFSPKRLFERMHLYDYFLFTTSKDLLPTIFKLIPEKCVYVVHQSTYHLSHMRKSIIVSPLIRSDSLSIVEKPYVLPIYRKINNLIITNKNNFAVIGTFRFNKSTRVCYDKDMDQIEKLLKMKFKKDFKIFFFMRKNDWRKLSRYFPIIKNNNRIVNYPGLSTINMVKKLENVKFILPLAKKKGLFHWERLTGSIPLAVNLNIPMVIDEELMNIYDLKGCITYKNNLYESFDKALNINKSDYSELIEQVVRYKAENSKINEKKLNKLFFSDNKNIFKEAKKELEDFDKLNENTEETIKFTENKKKEKNLNKNEKKATDSELKIILDNFF